MSQKRKSRKILRDPDLGRDKPTRETLAHGRYVAVRGRGGLVNLDTTPHARMLRRGEITEKQYLGLDKFCTDRELARRDRSVTARYAPRVDGGGGDDFTARQIDAKKRAEAARRALGAAQAELIERVCVDGIAAGAVQMGRGLDYGSATRQVAAVMTALRLSGEALADHYGLG